VDENPPTTGVDTMSASFRSTRLSRVLPAASDPAVTVQ
jgi:hypothetical protein